MKNSPDIMARVLKSYKMMLGFYGAELVDEGSGRLRRAKNWQSQFQNMNRFTHNNLRITRILKFLGEIGLERYKLPFLTFFIKEIVANKQLPNCRSSLESYWVPTLRENADLEACVRYMQNPSHPPPTSVLLSPASDLPAAPPAADEAGGGGEERGSHAGPGLDGGGGEGEHGSHAMSGRGDGGGGAGAGAGTSPTFCTGWCRLM